MQIEQVWDSVYYLTKYVVLKFWFKMVDSVMYDPTNEFPK
jgi:hypothetical protein